MSVLLRLLALLLPPLARTRYREEWLADLAGAEEAGLPRRSVVLGAASLLLTIDRDSPLHTGDPRGLLPRRLARRGVALAAAAGVVLIGTYLTGGGIVPEAGAASPAAVELLGVLGRVVVGVALVIAGLAMIFLLGAAATARTLLARIASAALVIGPVVVAFGIYGFQVPAIVPTVGFVVFFGGMICGLIVLIGSRTIHLERRTATRRQRVPVALGGAAGVIALVVVGAVDLLVWNPIAKVPGLELSAIYAEMVTRDGFDIGANTAWVTGWAAFWIAAAIVVAVAALPGRESPLTPRRLIVLMLGLIGGAVFFRFFAGFGFGMSIADTFGTNGGDGSFVSALLPYLGQLALAGAILAVGWAPRVPLRPVETAAVG
ncbi:hypothetical protein GSU68_03425 [Rathayibacter sp. VKM Ac-2759]|uniref:hypothetical protein n=1 Tax=Rathayibacter sp. VKM Ac-2759 TaxID=2609252 RepID=UPI001317D643|nr:hypothetical protein [Rathayibacter sp. VKM Ac-2759]QHC65728.1 hypothetical protein GSU68_03425 [Rathayibacter sp. VKM Ac-2759]